MNEAKAKQIGSRVTAIGITIGLLVAYSIMASFSYQGTAKSFFSWFFPFINGLWFNFLIALMALYFFGYVFGQKAGYNIIIKNKNFFWAFFKTGLLTLWFATFIGSLVGFFEEGLINDFGLTNAVTDYIGKPLYWVTFFGVPFLIMISPLLGWCIKKTGSKMA
jgi:hypothetical protein